MPPVPRGALPVRQRRGRRATPAACTASPPPHRPRRGAPPVEGTRDGEDTAARPSYLLPPQGHCLSGGGRGSREGREGVQGGAPPPPPK